MDQASVLYGVRCGGPDRRRTAHALLAFAAGQAWGWTELPAMARGERGKPFFQSAPEKQFSLSHTEGLCLCALSGAGPVGVDVELVRSRRKSLPRYVMSEEEFSRFDGSWEQFYRIWTLKEAYCKYLGGAVYPPREVPAPPPVPYRCYGGEGWRAALCGEMCLPEKILWVDERALCGTN